MHRHCDTNNRAPWWTFTDPCKPEVRPETEYREKQEAIRTPIVHLGTFGMKQMLINDRPENTNLVEDDEILLPVN